MKYTEFHRIIRRNGWVEVRQEGSHKIYSKEGYPDKSVPFHKGKEIYEPLRRRISKEMGL
ncbi:type II toxin-antitoxin system HicA family toxin [Muribaculum intestinale]|uniref:type II toxin-antitoxin system HicA family toxin n=1 Tax=Muribaculum intestinale TaxID=1796646 RepID=UPI0025B7425B